MTRQHLFFVMSASRCSQVSPPLLRFLELLPLVALVELAVPVAPGQPQLGAVQESLLSPSAGIHGPRLFFPVFEPLRPLSGTLPLRSHFPFRSNLRGSVKTRFVFRNRRRCKALR